MEPSATNLTTPDIEDQDITTEDIEQMMSELFEDMLGLPIFRIEAQADEVFESGLCGKIAVNGTWAASINVTATRKLSDQLGCAMFGEEPDSLDDEDVKDAVGEMANVIGGNIKGIIDQDCNLTIPEVVDFNSETPISSSALWFECDGESFCVDMKIGQ